VLENWEAMLPKFVKVYPQEYKKAMKKRVASAMLPVQSFPVRQVVHG
jgi:glutamate synthase domain-containing protein 3